MADNQIYYRLGDMVAPYSLYTQFPGHGIYGDGNDGTVTLSVNTTLSKDMAYDNLTVASGITLTTAGYRIFVRHQLTNLGTITVPTAAASGHTAGAVTASAHFGVGIIGAVGNATTVGTAGGANTKANGGGGGAGGASTVSVNAGGAGGAITNTMDVGDATTIHHPFCFITGMALGTTDKINGGGGGGGGGSDTSTYSGAGGAGGGVLFIVARFIDNTLGVISCQGGNGGNAATGTSGGGGGGGGGFVGIVTQHFIGNVPNVAGGLGGTNGVTGGVNGNPGSAGNYVILAM